MLYDDLEFEVKEIGSRTQKKIRALEKQILDFDAKRKTARSDRLKKQIATDYWNDLLEKQNRGQGISQTEKKESIEAEYQRVENRTRCGWTVLRQRFQTWMNIFADRKSKIQVAGVTERGPAQKL